MSLVVSFAHGVDGGVVNVIVVSGFVCDKCLTMSRGESVSIAYASSFRVAHFSPTSCVCNCNGLLKSLYLLISVLTEKNLRNKTGRVTWEEAISFECIYPLTLSHCQRPLIPK